jgi:hypothetical protein
MPQYIDVEAFETRFKQLINEATSLPPHEANQMACMSANGYYVPPKYPNMS